MHSIRSGASNAAVAAATTIGRPNLSYQVLHQVHPQVEVVFGQEAMYEGANISEFFARSDFVSNIRFFLNIGMLLLFDHRATIH